MYMFLSVVCSVMSGPKCDNCERCCCAGLTRKWLSPKESDMSVYAKLCQSMISRALLTVQTNLQRSRTGMAGGTCNVKSVQGVQGLKRA